MSRLISPFRLLGCVGLLVVAGLAGLYRDRVVGFVRDHLPGARAPAAAASVGHPSAQGLRAARDKVDSLNGWRADSVVLTAEEMASLIASGLDPVASKWFDSLEVRLGDRNIDVAASVETSAIPTGSLGPLGGMVGPRERIQAGGQVEIAQPGRALWIVNRLAVGELPLPKDLIPRLLEKALGGDRSSAVPFVVPKGITGIRIRPSGVALYGAHVPQ